MYACCDWPDKIRNPFHLSVRVLFIILHPVFRIRQGKNVLRSKIITMEENFEKAFCVLHESLDLCEYAVVNEIFLYD